jgi:hypothetical protein
MVLLNNSRKFHELLRAGQGKPIDQGSTVEWHGWHVPLFDASLHVGHLPGRKSLCLYVEVTHEGDNYIDPLAYFRNEHYAQAGLMFLDELVRGRTLHGSVRMRS